MYRLVVAGRRTVRSSTTLPSFSTADREGGGAEVGDGGGPGLVGAGGVVDVVAGERARLADLGVRPEAFRVHGHPTRRRQVERPLGGRHDDEGDLLRDVGVDRLVLTRVGVRLSGPKRADVGLARRQLRGVHLEMGQPALTGVVDVDLVLDGVPGDDAGGPGDRQVDLHRRRQRAEVDHRECVAHLARVVAPVERVPDTELAEGVRPPALDGVVVEPGAGPEQAAGDRGGGAASAQRDRREVVTHLEDPIAARVGVFEAERPVGVVPPALDGPIVEEGARGAAQADPDRRAVRCPASTAESAVAHLAGVVAPVASAVARPQPLNVAAPALDRDVGDQAHVCRTPR